MSKRKRRGGKSGELNLDKVNFVKDTDKRSFSMGDLPSWARKPDVSRFLEVREKLTDPEVYSDPEKLEQVKEEVMHLREIAMGKSVELRDMVNRNMEMSKMRAHMSMPPEMANLMKSQGADWSKKFDIPAMKDPYFYGLAQSKGIDPDGPIDVQGLPDDYLVWACPKCGNTNTNFVQLSTKKQKQYAKRYKFLDYDDLHRDKGYRYCSKCKSDHDLGFMVKMTMEKVDELQLKDAERERKQRNRHPDSLRMSSESERKATRKRLEKRRERKEEKDKKHKH